MAIKKILIGAAAAIVALGGSFWISRVKDSGSERSSQWVRSTRLAQHQDHPLGLAIDGDYVYFATGGFASADNAIQRVKTGGGPVEKVVTVKQIVSGELIVDGDYVYFTSEADQAVLQVQKTGGTATVLAQVPGPIFLASDASHIYFTTFSKQAESGTLGRIPKAGGPAEVILRGHPGMEQLVVDDRSIYFRSNRGLWKVAKAGGEPEQLVARAENHNLDRLVADDTHLYFLYESKNPGRYEVARLPKTGGIPETIGPIGDGSGRLALSSTHIYYFREASINENLLVKVPKAGGPPETVDGSGYNTGYLQVAGGDVYFTDISKVYRVPK